MTEENRLIRVKPLHTGGTSNALDGIDGAVLQAREFCFVMPGDPGGGSHYVYEAVESGATPAFPDCIPPATNPGNWRWHLRSSWIAENLRPVANLAADHSVSGIISTLQVGENVAFGDQLYRKADGKLWKADMSSANTMPVVAMAAGTIAADTYGPVLELGYARDDSWNWTLGGSAGLIYASTAGGLTQTRPTSGKIQVVAIATHADRLFFAPGIMEPEAATTSAAGLLKKATSATIDAGTADDEAMTPAGHAASNFGQRIINFPIFGAAEEVAANTEYDQFLLIPPELDGMEIKYVAATGWWALGVDQVYELWRARAAKVLGDATTEWAVTNPTGTTARYTRTGGTDPGISNSTGSLQPGDFISITGNFSAENQLSYQELTGVGAGYFEVDNSDLVEESGKAGDLTVEWAERKVATGSVGNLTIDADVDDLSCDPVGGAGYDYLLPYVATAVSGEYGLNYLIGVGLPE